MQLHLSTLSICFIFWVTSFLNLAQTDSKFGIGFSYSPGFSFISHTNQKDIDIALYDEIKSSEYGIVTHDLALFGMYQLSQKFEVNFGIGFHSTGYQTRAYQPLIDNPEFDQVKFKTSASYFTIPINVNYFMTDHFYITAGGAVEFNLNHTTRRIETLGKEETTSKMEANDEATPIYSFLNLKIGYQIDFSNTLQFRIAPCIRYTPSDYLTDEAAINRRFLEFGGEFSLIKKF